MKSALIILFVLMLPNLLLAEVREMEIDLQNVCEEEINSADIKLMGKEYFQSPNSTLIPDVKQILKVVNSRNRHRHACETIMKLAADGATAAFVTKNDEDGNSWKIKFSFGSGTTLKKLPLKIMIHKNKNAFHLTFFNQKQVADRGPANFKYDLFLDGITLYPEMKKSPDN